MKEVMKALAERPMTAPVLARTTGLDEEMLGDIVSGLIGQDLVEENGNKFSLTAAGIKALGIANSSASLPPSGGLMDLGDDDSITPESLLPFISEAKSAKAVAEHAGITKSRAGALLRKLRASGQAEIKSNGYWKAIAATTAATVTADKPKQATPVAEVEEVIEVDVPEHLEQQPANSAVHAALANLKSSLTKRTVKNLQTKLEVLARLGELLDPTIGEVLADIQNDLKVAA